MAVRSNPPAGEESSGTALNRIKLRSSAAKPQPPPVKKSTSTRRRQQAKAMRQEEVDSDDDDLVQEQTADALRGATKVSFWRPVDGKLPRPQDDSSKIVRRMQQLGLRMYSHKINPGQGVSPRSASSRPSAANGRARRAGSTISDILPQHRATFGSISFGALETSMPHGNQYVCVTKHMTDARMGELLSAYQLPEPSVVLSITGADETEVLNLPSAVERAYIEGITSIAGKTDAWIITGGFDDGAAGLTGKAVQQISSSQGASAGAESASRFACIGLAPLDIVMFRNSKFLPDSELRDHYLQSFLHAPSPEDGGLYESISSKASSKANETAAMVRELNLSTWKLQGTQAGLKLVPATRTGKNETYYSTVERVLEVLYAGKALPDSDRRRNFRHAPRVLQNLVEELRNWANLHANDLHRATDADADRRSSSELGSPLQQRRSMSDVMEGSEQSFAAGSNSNFLRGHIEVDVGPGGTINRFERKLSEHAEARQWLCEAIVHAALIAKAEHRPVKGYIKRMQNCPKMLMADDPTASTGQFAQYDNTGYALDPSHTHYILVDEPPEIRAERFKDLYEPPSSASSHRDDHVDMRADAQFRKQLEAHVHARDTLKEVPLLCVCLGGGRTAYAKCLEVLETDNPLILIKESGGCAEQVARLVEYANEAVLRGEKPWEPRVSEAKLIELGFGPAELDSHARKLAKLVLHTIKQDKESEEAKENRPSLLYVYKDHHISFGQMIFEAIVGAYRRQSARLATREKLREGRKKRYEPLGPRPSVAHEAARSKHPAYPKRAPVPNDKVAWTTPWPEYEAVLFEHDAVLKNACNLPTGHKWADMPDVADIGDDLYERMTFELCSLVKAETHGVVPDEKTLRMMYDAGFVVSKSGLGKSVLESEASHVGALLFRESSGKHFPMNPRGRTGMVGRGLLGRWGPNHAADPIVTRWNPDKDDWLEVVAIQRRDTGEWALPGGMVDPGEKVSVTVRREFMEEAAQFEPGDPQREEMEGFINQLFSRGTIVYRGYVDDPRNTDNAWMETTAFHFHCPPNLAKRLNLQHGDDAAKVTWLHVNADEEPRYAALYANHREMVDIVKDRLTNHKHAREKGPKGFTQIVDGKKVNFPGYPQRFHVPHDLVSWKVPWPEHSNYRPVEFTGGQVLQASRDINPSLPLSRAADPHDVLGAMHSLALTDSTKREKCFVHELREDRCTFEGEITFYEDAPRRSSYRASGGSVQEGRPLNPRGRSGMTGRGFHYKWGVNEACDTIVTRYHPRDNKLQFVARLIEQTYEWEEVPSRPSTGKDRTKDFPRLVEALKSARNSSAANPRLHEFDDQEHSQLCPASKSVNSRHALRAEDYVRIEYDPSCTASRAVAPAIPDCRSSASYPGIEDLRSNSEGGTPISPQASVDGRTVRSPEPRGPAYSIQMAQRALEQSADAAVAILKPARHFVLHPPKRVWGIPGGVLRHGENPKSKAQSLFAERVLAKMASLNRTPEEQDRLEFLVNELFASVDKNVVYTGYVDDHRNTDNAWMETTAFHFHCSRELGGMLPLGVGTDFNSVKQGDPMWISVSEKDRWELDINLFGNHNTFIERVARDMEKARQRGLLLNVVTWGKKEWAEQVFDDPVLVEHRTPAAVQQAFQAALKRAGDHRRFDVRILEMLVRHGAIPADVFVTDLFHGGGGVDDAFGHLRDLNAGRYSRRRRHVSGLVGQFAEDVKRGVAAVGDTFVDGVEAVQDVIEARGSVYENPRAGTAAGARGGSRKKSLSMKRLDEVGDAVHATTPYRKEHMELMRVYVKGFQYYAARRHAASSLDLMLWSIIAGSLKGAFQLWTLTQSPLRASLIGQEVCKRMIDRSAIRRAELRELFDDLSDSAVGILENFGSQEVARKILSASDGPFAVLGSSGSKVLSVIDLAIYLGNIEFVGHRHSQSILDERWMGRSPESGCVRLSHMHSIFTLIAQIMLAPFFVQIIPLRFNDLYHWPHCNEDEWGGDGSFLESWHCFRSTRKGSHIKLSRVRVFTGYFQIPLVKRAFAAMSNFAYIILGTYVFYSTLCGALNWGHYLFFLWTASRILDEITGFQAEASLFWLSGFNLIDLGINFCMTIAVIMRVMLAYNPAGPFSVWAEPNNNPTVVQDLWSWLQEIFPDWHLRPADYWLVGPPGYPDANDFGFVYSCDWSLELELMRIFSALALALHVMRMLEYTVFSRSTGVLMVCLEKMALFDLLTWVKPTLFITVAAAMGNGVLAPNLRHEYTQPLMPIPGLNLDFSVGGPFWAMLWALFGFYEPSTLGYMAPSTSIMAPVWLWLYLVFALVLLINLLIAMFAQTYQDVMENADMQWRLKRVLMGRPYALAPVFPPPLNLIEWPAAAAWRFMQACSVAARPTASKGGGAGGGGGGGGDDDDDDVVRSTFRKAARSALVRNQGAKAKVKPSMQQAYAFEYASVIESRALQLLLKQRQFKEQVQPIKKVESIVTVIKDSLKTLQTDSWEGNARLEKNIASLAKRPLLGYMDKLPQGPASPKSAEDGTVMSAPGGSADQVALLTETISSFGRAIDDTIKPLNTKVEKLDETLHAMQARLGLAPAALVKPGHTTADPKQSRVAGYVLGAHALSSQAYRPPPPTPASAPGSSPPHRKAPPMPSSGGLQRSASSTPLGRAATFSGGPGGLTLSKSTLPPLPPPTSTDAGPEPYPEDILQAFYRFDRDHSGGIDVAELRECLEVLGLRGIDIAEASRLHSDYDDDRTGILELDEFSRLVVDVRAKTRSERTQGRTLGDLTRACDITREYLMSEGRDGGAGSSSMRSSGGATVGMGEPPPAAPYTMLPPGSEAARDEVGRVFALHDRHGEGTMKLPQLSAALAALGLETTTSQATQIFNKYDRDRSGEIDRLEFEELATELRQFQAKMEELSVGAVAAGLSSGGLRSFAL